MSEKNLILGISISHDGTISVLEDGRHVFAIGEERLTRTKGKIGFPFKALRYVVEEKIVRPESVSVAVVGQALFLPEWYKTFQFILTEDKTYWDIQNDPRPENAYVNDALDREVRTKEECTEYVREKIAAILGESGIHCPVKFVNHHVAHAMSVCAAKEWKRALVVTLDGEGDLLCGNVGTIEAGHYELLHEEPQSHSIGNIYSEVTKACGFKISRHEGKITGLAARGVPGRTGEIMERLFQHAEGRFILDKSPREILLEAIDGRETVPMAELASAVQTLLQKRVAEFVEWWLRKTGMEHVLLAGGVFANVRLNQEIAAIQGVKGVFVFPNMGDGGGAFGAAIHEHRQRHGAIPRESLESVFLGPDYDDLQIEERMRPFLDRVQCETVDEPERIAARLVADGVVVGWFQGRMEYGPRALGHRSILASPREAGINDILNKRLRRTEFMPFAPSCLVESAQEVFEIGSPELLHTAEFMTITFQVRDRWKHLIPAVVHLDGTARPHLVKSSVDPIYHRLLEEHRRITGLPLVVNTSFNAHEEPIVCTPEDAVRSLIENCVDVLFVGNRMIRLLA